MSCEHKRKAQMTGGSGSAAGALRVVWCEDCPAVFYRTPGHGPMPTREERRLAIEAVAESGVEPTPEALTAALPVTLDPCAVAR